MTVTQIVILLRALSPTNLRTALPPSYAMSRSQSFDDDPDLSKAIALSLQESSRTDNSTNPAAEDEEEDEEYQEQLKRAMEASQSQPTPEPDAHDEVAHSTATKSFLSERAQLEKERLKRIRKAKGLPEESDEDQNVRNGDVEQEDEEDEIQIVEPPRKRQRVSSPLRTQADHSSYSSSGVSTSKGKGTSGNDGGERYWNGEMRPTATAGMEPRKDGKRTFRISEILGEKDSISFAIISTFALDLPWIYQLFERSVPVILVAQPDNSGRAGMHNALPNWIKTMPFLPGGHGCMHMKIFYKTGRLRVAITTANLVPFDWKDIENAAWVQDLHSLDTPSKFDIKNTASFQYVMKRVLDNLNVRPALATLLRQGHPTLPIQSTQELCVKWDWSKVRVHLVPSIAGKHEGWPSVVMTGHPRLMKAVMDLGLRTGKGLKAKELQVEYQGSSIGTYSTQWINEWFWSARGESAEAWLDEPRRKREKYPYPSGMQILFPSKATVDSSQYGERGGGTNFCTRTQWEGTKFPRHLFRDSKSKAGPTLMHTKTVIATFSEKRKGREVETIDISDDSTIESESDDEIQIIETAIGWAYMGSHNFTPSAWGTLSGSGFNPIMNIRNYELGIVFPLKSKADVEKVAAWERPPPKYAGVEPWIQEESEYFRKR
ncbi:phospholipase D/nuclease [Marasmius fiardii PR-910]|nr:phospholipase D/nuclease [Marasmius fiardii PR-910]